MIAQVVEEVDGRVLVLGANGVMEFTGEGVDGFRVLEALQVLLENGGDWPAEKVNNAEIIRDGNWLDVDVDKLTELIPGAEKYFAKPREYVEIIADQITGETFTVDTTTKTREPPKPEWEEKQLDRAGRLFKRDQPSVRKDTALCNLCTKPLTAINITDNDGMMYCSHECLDQVIAKKAEWDKAMARVSKQTTAETMRELTRTLKETQKEIKALSTTMTGPFGEVVKKRGE
jgi:hypothetical protein